MHVDRLITRTAAQGPALAGVIGEPARPFTAVVLKAHVTHPRRWGRVAGAQLQRHRPAGSGGAIAVDDYATAGPLGVDIPRPLGRGGVSVADAVRRLYPEGVDAIGQTVVLLAVPLVAGPEGLIVYAALERGALLRRRKLELGPRLIVESGRL